MSKLELSFQVLAEYFGFLFSLIDSMFHISRLNKDQTDFFSLLPNITMLSTRTTFQFD